MSLPLTRRIAKTVLLTAAGAASVVGTAGAANAAEVPTTADVGGLSTLDVATETEGAEALTPKSGTAPLAPVAEAAPAPSGSALPEARATFETDTPPAGVGVDTDNAGLAYEMAEMGTSLALGRPPQAPEARNATPKVHTKGLLGETAPEGQPNPFAPPQQQSPEQQNSSQQDQARQQSQDPAQQAQQDAAELMEQQAQPPLGGVVGTSGLGKALTNGMGSLNLH